MLKLMSRLLQTQRDSYARRVATLLFKEGFDPKLFDDMQAIGAFSEGSIIFRVLQDSKLRPEDAARAVMMASHLYASTRYTAEVQGWPTVTVVQAQWPKHEAYFMSLLQEAAKSLRPPVGP